MPAINGERKKKNQTETQKQCFVFEIDLIICKFNYHFFFVFPSQQIGDTLDYAPQRTIWNSFDCNLISLQISFLLLDFSSFLWNGIGSCFGNSYSIDHFHNKSGILSDPFVRLHVFRRISVINRCELMNVMHTFSPFVYLQYCAAALLHFASFTILKRTTRNTRTHNLSNVRCRLFICFEFSIIVPT